MFRKHFLAAVLLALILFSPSSAAAQDAPEEEAVQAYVYLTRPNPEIVITQDAETPASSTYITAAEAAEAYKAAESRSHPVSRLVDAVKACAGKVRAMFLKI
jgi:hypothetical protein